MPAKTAGYPPEVCGRLDKIVEARDQEKAREQELIRTRKSLKDDLLKLGSGSTKKHLDVSRDYVVTLFALEASRNRQKSLADRMDETVKKAHEPTFWADRADNDEDIDGRELDEAVVFEVLKNAAPKDDDEREDPDQAKLPVGEKEPGAKDSKKDDKVPAGLKPADLKSEIGELQLEPAINQRLVAAGCKTIGDLIKLEDQSAEGIEVISGIGGATAAKIRSALKKFQRVAKAASN